MHTMHFLPGIAIQPNLELKTRPKQLLGSLPLVIVLPTYSRKKFYNIDTWFGGLYRVLAYIALKEKIIKIIKFLKSFEFYKIFHKTLSMSGHLASQTVETLNLAPLFITGWTCKYSSTPCFRSS
jgi:hypothetical protein